LITFKIKGNFSSGQSLSNREKREGKSEGGSCERREGVKRIGKPNLHPDLHSFFLAILQKNTKKSFSV
jgi:hypothetical protein